MGSKERLLAHAGEQIKKLRLAKKNSIYTVAKSIHISGNYLSEIERGVKEPSDVVLCSIAEYYDIERSELFALYDRVAPEEAHLLAQSPHLRKVITQLSADEQLTDGEKEFLSKEFQKLYEKMVKRNRGT